MAALRRNCAGSLVGRSFDDVLQSKCVGLRFRLTLVRTSFVDVADRRRLPFRRNHLKHCFADSAHAPSLDRRMASIFRSLAGNRSSAGDHRSVACADAETDAIKKANVSELRSNKRAISLDPLLANIFPSVFSRFVMSILREIGGQSGIAQ
jgi:hypothetical protein